MKYSTMETEVYMPIPTQLTKLLERKADWKVGYILQTTDKFVTGEEILFLVLGDGEIALVHRMPYIDKNTHLRDLHTKMIQDGVQIPSSCISAHSKE